MICFLEDIVVLKVCKYVYVTRGCEGVIICVQVFICLSLYLLNLIKERVSNSIH